MFFIHGSYNFTYVKGGVINNATHLEGVDFNNASSLS